MRRDTMRHSRVSSLVTSALLVALLAASAWITLPLGPVPATLQTFVVVLIALICAPSQAAGTLGAYVLLGAAGVPVFSSAQGGVATLVGPTGGYVLGFVLGATAGAAVVRLASARGERASAAPTPEGSGARAGADSAGRGSQHPRPARSVPVDALAAAVTLAVVYTCGVLWLSRSTGLTLGAAVAVGVVPFLLLDAVKATAAVAVAAVLRRAGVA